jgi:hypothetical protein
MQRSFKRTLSPQGATGITGRPGSARQLYYKAGGSTRAMQVAEEIGEHLEKCKPLRRMSNEVRRPVTVQELYRDLAWIKDTDFPAIGAEVERKKGLPILVILSNHRGNAVIVVLSELVELSRPVHGLLAPHHWLAAAPKMIGELLGSGAVVLSFESTVRFPNVHPPFLRPMSILEALRNNPSPAWRKSFFENVHEFSAKAASDMIWSHRPIVDQLPDSWSGNLQSKDFVYLRNKGATLWALMWVDTLRSFCDGSLHAGLEDTATSLLLKNIQAKSSPGRGLTHERALRNEILSERTRIGMDVVEKWMKSRAPAPRKRVLSGQEVPVARVVAHPRVQESGTALAGSSSTLVAPSSATALPATATSGAFEAEAATEAAEALLSLSGTTTTSQGGTSSDYLDLSENTIVSEFQHELGSARELDVEVTWQTRVVVPTEEQVTILDEEPPRKRNASYNGIATGAKNCQLPYTHRSNCLEGHGCTYCGLAGHGGRKNCPEYKAVSKLSCQICFYPICEQYTTHMTEACDQLHGYCQRCGCRGHTADKCGSSALSLIQQKEAYEIYSSRSYFLKSKPKIRDWSYEGPVGGLSGLEAVEVDNRRYYLRPEDVRVIMRADLKRRWEVLKALL